MSRVGQSQAWSQQSDQQKSAMQVSVDVLTQLLAASMVRSCMVFVEMQ